MTDYDPTVWVNGVPPAVNATNPATVWSFADIEINVVQPGSQGKTPARKRPNPISITKLLLMYKDILPLIFRNIPIEKININIPTGIRPP